MTLWALFDRPVSILGLRLEGVAGGVQLLPLRRVPDVGSGEPLRLPVTLPPGSTLRLLRGARVSPGACLRLGRETSVAVATRLRVRYRVRYRTLTDELDVSRALRTGSCTGENGGFSP